MSIPWSRDALGNISHELLEYERIVLSPMVDPKDASIPDWRNAYLAKIARYEAYLKKYPTGSLVAEVKLRIAELYRDVEKPEIYPLRLEMYQCISQYQNDNEHHEQKREECINEFWGKSELWRDPVYKEKAVVLLIELVEKYGHTKRYSMETPMIGGFRWVEEEIGAVALYILSGGAETKIKKQILLTIIEKYKPGPKLRKEIEEDLEKLK